MAGWLMANVDEDKAGHRQIAPGVYFYSDNSNWVKKRILGHLFDFYGIDKGKLLFEVKV